MGLEVEKGRKEGVIKKLKETYPDLEIKVEEDKVLVSGDLKNYKKRNNIMYILSGGKHGKAIQTS